MLFYIVNRLEIYHIIDPELVVDVQSLMKGDIYQVYICQKHKAVRKKGRYTNEVDDRFFAFSCSLGYN